jgi:hypothetical protein
VQDTRLLDKNKKAFSLIEPIELIQFRKKITSTFDLTLSDEKWEDIKNKFLKVIQGS